MPLYRCEWPNGDVSFVLASDVDDAIEQLDEWGSATPKMIKRLRQFMIDLKPNRETLERREQYRRSGQSEPDKDDPCDYPWELNALGECMESSEPDGMPTETRTLRRIKSFEQHRKQADLEWELRRKAEEEGSLVDLTMRRMKKAIDSLPSVSDLEH